MLNLKSKNGGKFQELRAKIYDYKLHSREAYEGPLYDDMRAASKINFKTSISITLLLLMREVLEVLSLKLRDVFETLFLKLREV